MAVISLDEKNRRLRASPRDRNGIDARPLGGEREMRRRQGVANPAGEGAEGDDGKLGRRRQRAADQRAEGEDQSIASRQGIGSRHRLMCQDPASQPDSAQEPAENLGRQRDER